MTDLFITKGRDMGGKMHYGKRFGTSTVNLNYGPDIHHDFKIPKRTKKGRERAALSNHLRHIKVTLATKPMKADDIK